MNVLSRTTFAVSSIACLLFAAETHCASRVIEYDFAVNDSESYEVTSTTSIEIISTSYVGTGELNYDLELEVTTDNGSGNFDIELNQSNGTQTKGSGSPTSLASGSDTIKQNTGQGRITHNLDYTLLFPNSEISAASMGTVSETDPPFVSTAVDVNDTWTQDISVTPYNSTAQTVTVTHTLVEWTTLLGYDVAMIHSTWTQPIHAKSGKDGELYGELDMERDTWFAYTDKILVKSVETGEGLLSFKESPSSAVESVDFSNSETTAIK